MNQKKSISCPWTGLDWTGLVGQASSQPELRTEGDNKGNKANLDIRLLPTYRNGLMVDLLAVEIRPTGCLGAQ